MYAALVANRPPSMHLHLVHLLFDCINKYTCISFIIWTDFQSIIEKMIPVNHSKNLRQEFSRINQIIYSSYSWPSFRFIQPKMVFLDSLLSNQANINVDLTVQKQPDTTRVEKWSGSLDSVLAQIWLCHIRRKKGFWLGPELSQTRFPWFVNLQVPALTQDTYRTVFF